MRTAFTFDDDKQLVQLARKYVETNQRIVWADIARMSSTGHKAAALRQRLQSLYRTWGRDITRFPPNFFTAVRRPRGRPPPATRRLRSFAVDLSIRHQRSEVVIPIRAADIAAVEIEALQPSTQRQRRAANSASPPSVHHVPEPPITSPVNPVMTLPAQEGPAPSSQCPANKPTGLEESTPPDRPSCSAESEVPLLSPSMAEQVVASIFADVPRATVAHGGGTPHLNVGEVLPAGVTTLLRELGDIDSSDVFFDIGAGLGNIVTQVALATKVSKAIGIELRSQVYSVGVEKIARNYLGRQASSRIELYCNDISSIGFSRILPFEAATIVFWNNILFEPATIEYVKREISVMASVRLFVCSAPICPRHREPCFSQCCLTFEQFKEADILCSWKGDPQRVYFYRSLQPI
ncbi:hypothetical protein DVH05_017084 [Phytophthora capsici]|nr:hypothetical protein DVH05_017084 [Phytophthora capsici]